MNTMITAQTNGNLTHGDAANAPRFSFTATLLSLMKYVRPMEEGSELTFLAQADVVEQKQPGAVANVLRMLTESYDEREARAEQAYLAEATDMYDLEFRSRECDRQRRSNGY